MPRVQNALRDRKPDLDNREPRRNANYRKYHIQPSEKLQKAITVFEERFASGKVLHFRGNIKAYRVKREIISFFNSFFLSSIQLVVEFYLLYKAEYKIGVVSIGM